MSLSLHEKDTRTHLVDDNVVGRMGPSEQVGVLADHRDMFLSRWSVETPYVCASIPTRITHHAAQMIAH